MSLNTSQQIPRNESRYKNERFCSLKITLDSQAGNGKRVGINAHIQVNRPVQENPLENNREEDLLLSTQLSNKRRSSQNASNIGTSQQITGDVSMLQKLEDTKFHLLICVTVYNESIEDVNKTLEGIRANFDKFDKKCNIGVFFIFDGIQHMNDSILEDEYLIEKEVVDKLIKYKKKLVCQRDYFDDVLLKQGALFLVSKRNKNSDISDKEQVGLHEGNYFHLFFCFKFYNGHKLDSHKWFLRGFCTFPSAKTDFFAFLDCGAQPEADAIFKLYQAMVYDKDIAGTCGYMSLYKQSILNEHSLRHDQQWKLDFLSKTCDKIFCIQEAQIFEYSFSHIFDKPFESLFGFIQVLPGAFSLYRWERIEKCLDKYVPWEGLQVNFSESEASRYPDEASRNLAKAIRYLVKANRYLAEDRILCLELFLQEGARNLLKYVPDAVVRVDPVIHLIILMNQRRRWINGSLYAMIDVIKNSLTNRGTTHNKLRLFFFWILTFYNALMILISYFTLGFYFVFLEILTSQYLNEFEIFSFSRQFTRLSDIIMFLYICLVGSLLFYSIYYKARERPEKFYRASNVLGVFMLISFAYGLTQFIIYMIKEDYSNFFQLELVWYERVDYIRRPVLRLLILLNAASYVLPSIFYPHKIIKDVAISAKDYIFFSPTYIHNLVIYAYCNVDDISWGTKGQETSADNKKAVGFKQYKMKVVMLWIFLNILLSYTLICLNSYPIFRINFLLWMTYFYTAISIVRSAGSFLYHAKYYFWEKPRYYCGKNSQRI